MENRSTKPTDIVHLWYWWIRNCNGNACTERGTWTSGALRQIPSSSQGNVWVVWHCVCSVHLFHTLLCLFERQIRLLWTDIHTSTFPVECLLVSTTIACWCVINLSESVRKYSSTFIKILCSKNKGKNKHTVKPAKSMSLIPCSLWLCQFNCVQVSCGPVRWRNMPVLFIRRCPGWPMRQLLPNARPRRSNRSAMPCFADTQSDLSPFLAHVHQVGFSTTQARDMDQGQLEIGSLVPKSCCQLSGKYRGSEVQGRTEAFLGYQGFEMGSEDTRYWRWHERKGTV